MLGMIQLLCGILYAAVLCGIVASGLPREWNVGKERYVRIHDALKAEQQIFYARHTLLPDEYLVVGLTTDQFYDCELRYILTHMQRKDPAMRILWIREKEARAG